MAENSKIEWTTHTFNAWEGCEKISPACEHCYAERRDKQYHNGTHWGPNSTRKMMRGSYWQQPLKWNREAANADEHPRVFTLSLGDWLENHPDLLIPRAQLLRMAALTKNLNWLFLTKRPEDWRDRMLEVAAWWDQQGFASQQDAEELRAWVAGEIIPQNFWIGTTVENQKYADQRIPALAKISARIRFLSIEPMLGEIDLSRYEFAPDWVIAGGESGADARPSNPDWFRSLRDQCVSARIAFFFKQWGNNVTLPKAAELGVKLSITDALNANTLGKGFVHISKKTAGRELDGRTWDEIPS